ncbi:MAG: dockerin type I domain-containing protein, partial [Clostridiales bacterium]|nr:dockerin type I domain-containing protein [Clostridiales bacterium]
NDIFWTYAGENTWKGSVTLTYGAGDSNGFNTGNKLVDIGKFIFAPTGEDEATLTLTGLSVVGLDGGTTKRLPCEIAVSTATTNVEQTLYSKYDLNRDNVVDALDLGIMLLYCGFKAEDPEWATFVKVNDSKGKPVTASMCDVNNDGVINMLDLIDLFINYTK